MAAKTHWRRSPTAARASSWPGPRSRRCRGQHRSLIAPAGPGAPRTSCCMHERHAATAQRARLRRAQPGPGGHRAPARRRLGRRRRRALGVDAGHRGGGGRPGHAGRHHRPGQHPRALTKTAEAHGARRPGRQRRVRLRRHAQRPVRRRPAGRGRADRVRRLGGGARPRGLHLPLGRRALRGRAGPPGDAHPGHRRLGAARDARARACGPRAPSPSGPSRRPPRSSCASRASTSPC